MVKIVTIIGKPYLALFSETIFSLRNCACLCTFVCHCFSELVESWPVPLSHLIMLRQIIVKVRNTLFKGLANKRQITIVTNLFII